MSAHTELIAEARKRALSFTELAVFENVGLNLNTASFLNELADALEAAEVTLAEDVIYMRRIEGERDAALAKLKVAESPTNPVAEGSEREALIMAIMHHPWLEDRGGDWRKGYCPTCDKLIGAGYNSPAHAGHIADALIHGGYGLEAESPTTVEWGIQLGGFAEAEKRSVAVKRVQHWNATRSRSCDMELVRRNVGPWELVQS